MSSFYGDGSNVSYENYDSWQDYDYTHQTMTTALAEQETRLRKEFDEKLQKETEALKARFDYILYNEQIRTSHMLHEAHRERKEKVRALTQQLECKNLAALMYVMCAERTKCKMERLQLVEKYTNYINMLNDILTEGQELILNLSRGYKTAARVDFEWKEKIKKIIDQFLKYIYYSTGTPVEQNQFYFDYEHLSMIESSTVENPKEDPIQEDPTEIIECIDGKWWEKIDNPDVCQLFVGYGDMANWPPDRRRAIMNHLKAIKSAPRRWKEYAFHDMFLKSDCPKASEIKEDYLSRLPIEAKWECQSMAYDAGHDTNIRRMTTTSMDVRGNMGSLLKLITSGNGYAPNSNLLAARDSIELTSKTRLARSRTRTEAKQGEVFSLSDRRTSMYEEKYHDIFNADEPETPNKDERYKQDDSGMFDEDSRTFGKKSKGYGHTDSLEMVNKHIPGFDHRINFEKVCPMPSCRRMHVDAFMHSLPKYMRASPFTHFEQTFDGYQTLTPEQIEVLKSRIHLKKQRHQKLELRPQTEEPTLEWEYSVQGIGVQTSKIDQGFDDADMLPCTCEDENIGRNHESDSNGAISEVKDLPHTVKKHIDYVKKDFIWDKDIEFNRFKVVGEKGSSENGHDADKTRQSLHDINAHFTETRLQEITNILKENPSLLDLFQASMN